MLYSRGDNVKKVRDRLQLGVIAGLTGVAVKDLVGGLITRAGLAEDPARSAPPECCSLLLQKSQPLGAGRGLAGRCCRGQPAGNHVCLCIILHGQGSGCFERP